MLWIGPLTLKNAESLFELLRFSGHSGNFFTFGNHSGFKTLLRKNYPNLPNVSAKEIKSIFV